MRRGGFGGSSRGRGGAGGMTGAERGRGGAARAENAGRTQNLNSSSSTNTSAASNSQILPPDFAFDGVPDLLLAGDEVLDEAAAKRSDLYVAVLSEGDRLGIAYYDCEEGSLSVTSTFCSPSDVPWILSTFKQQLADREPTCFLTSSQVPEAVRKELAKRALPGDPTSVAGQQQQQQGSIPVKVLQSSTFRLEAARRALASLQLPEWQPKAKAEAFAEARQNAVSALAAAAAAAAAQRKKRAVTIASPSPPFSSAGGAGFDSRPHTALSIGAATAMSRSIANRVPKHPKDKSFSSSNGGSAAAAPGGGAGSIGLGGLLGNHKSSIGVGSGTGIGDGDEGDGETSRIEQLDDTATAAASAAAFSRPGTGALIMSSSAGRPGTAAAAVGSTAAAILALGQIEMAEAKATSIAAASSSSGASVDGSGAGGAAGSGSGLGRLSSYIDVADDHLIRTAGGLVQFLIKSRILLVAEETGNTGSAGGAGGVMSAAALDGSGGYGMDSEQDETDRLLASLRASASSSSSSAGFHQPPVSSLSYYFLPGGLSMFSLLDYLHIDATTYVALNITATANHPASGSGGGSGGGKAKEGFSLLALLDRTVSAPGKRLLRSWVKQPSLDMSVLLHRHDTVAFLMTAKASVAPDAYRELKSYLKAVKDVPRLLTRVKKANATAGDWFSLHRTVIAANMIRDLVASMLAMMAGSGGSGSGSGAAAAPKTHYSPSSPYLLRQILEDFSPAPAPTATSAGLTSGSNDLVFLQTALDQVIDWDESSSSSTASVGSAKLVIRSGIDGELDQYRHVRDNFPAYLTEASLAKLQDYPTLRSLRIRYLPQIGCVMAVDKAENGLVAVPEAEGDDPSARAPPLAYEQVIPDDFVLQFESTNEGSYGLGVLFFKCPYTEEMDRYFGDLAARINDLQAAIVRQLEAQVLAEYEGLLLLVSMRLAELDVLMSFADVSLDYRYVRPKLVEENVMFVKGARHPLQELVVGSGDGSGGGTGFVPNDIALAPGHRYMTATAAATSAAESNASSLNSSSASSTTTAASNVGAVAIVTGPNYSGKSVYLKTAGLITVMAQVGCFVPAEKCSLGLTDRLFSRIHSLETSTLTGQSSFSLDLSQIGLMMKHATPRSLLLIDEFGKGTSSVDGASLLAATVRHILRMPQRMAAKEYQQQLEALGLDTTTANGGGGGDSAGMGPFPSPVRLSLANAPKTIITTHFREVFDHGLLGLEGLVKAPLYYEGKAPSSESSSSPSASSTLSIASANTVDLSSNLSFFQMNVLLSSKRLLGATAFNNNSSTSGSASNEPPDYEDDVVPLFKLVAGRAASSYGLACAIRAGVPRFVTDRAAAVSSMLKNDSVVNPLPGFLEDERRRAVERQQIQIVSLLLKPSSWVAAGDSTGPAVASLNDIHRLVEAMKALFNGNNGNNGGSWVMETSGGGGGGLDGGSNSSPVGERAASTA